MNNKILTLQDLFAAHAMDAIPANSVWQSCGHNLVRAEISDWENVGAPGAVLDEEALGQGGFLCPTDPMGLAAIAAIVAWLCGLESLGAVLTVDDWAPGGVYVALDVGRADMGFFPHTVPALADLSGEDPDDRSRAVVAVVRHLLGLHA